MSKSTLASSIAALVLAASPNTSLADWTRRDLGVAGIHVKTDGRVFVQTAPELCSRPEGVEFRVSEVGGDAILSTLMAAHLAGERIDLDLYGGTGACGVRGVRVHD